ncbi:MAG: peptidoglycan recognition family protein [Acidobacteriota bacterium]
MIKRPFEQPDPTYARLVEHYSALISAPAQKLKFLRCALDKYQSHPLAERIGWLKQITFRKIIIEELVQYLPVEVPKPREVSFVFWLYRVRYPVYFTAILLGVVTTIATLQWAYGSAREAGVFDLRLVRNSESAATPVAPVAAAPNTVGSVTAQPTAEGELPEVEGFPANKIWLVERAKEYEQYSNGTRILTEYEVASEPRSFYTLRRKPPKQSTTLPFQPQYSSYYPELSSKPIGILYHVTQSDLSPFSPRFNQQLKGNTEQLLRYVRQEKLYNYLIDRFGRIYRVVSDDHYANHSGNSIWGDQQAVYINLNHSFLGVAFEGKWSADVRFNPDDINEAQLYAGKMLTEVLRSKYGIADINCVPHGLVSINPTDYLIGFHLDWAKGFPFALLGLKDKYLQPPPSIVEFGFKYDRAFINAIGGEPWPGIELAEARLRARAADLNLGLDTLRRNLQNDFTLYRRWLREMREEAKATGQGTSSEPSDEPLLPKRLVN